VEPELEQVLCGVTGTAAAGSSKLQSPGKLQYPSLKLEWEREASLVIDAWSFPGIRGLGFGDL
jgi:hypothetical protein